MASYALIVALSVGATVAPSISEARSPEERPTTAGPAAQDHGKAIGQWLNTAHDKVTVEPSYVQSWLAGVYQKLLGLKVAISSALSHAWKWSHGKSDNTCS
jgi:hypothetical protein